MSLVCPLLNSTGQLLDMNTKQLDTGQSIRTFVNAIIAPAPLQPLNTNRLHDNWNQGITAFYSNDFISAQSDFIRAGAANAQFQA
ncbi:MAG TPA: hypothetical protein DCL75_04305, partial [Ktedonobacter sp.]|nr:hypothetical protein [Ktedonobacter sp.]